MGEKKHFVVLCGPLKESVKQKGFWCWFKSSAILQARKKQSYWKQSGVWMRQNLSEIWKWGRVEALGQLLLWATVRRTWYTNLALHQQWREIQAFPDCLKYLKVLSVRNTEVNICCITPLLWSELAFPQAMLLAARTGKTIIVNRHAKHRTEACTGRLLVL